MKISQRQLRTPMVAVVAVAVLLASCSDGDSESRSADSSPDTGAEEVAPGQFASDNPGSVNTYWLQTSDGLVIVDTQRSLTDAGRALAAIEETRQDVAAIVLTHGHPDHVGGVGVLHEAFPQAPIYASKATRTTMETDPLGFFALTRELPGSDYAPELTLPDHVIGPGETLKIGDVGLETAEFGPGETESTTAYYEPESGALFTGDIINSEATPALLEGNTCGWLADLDGLREGFPDAQTIYPGHGAPGDPDELIDQQRTYLVELRDLVRPAVDPASAAGQEVTTDERQAIIDDVNARHPDYQSVASLPTLMEENVAAVARELLAEVDSAACPSS